MEQRTAAELEIRLQPSTADVVVVDVHFRDPATAGDSILASQVPVRFDIAGLSNSGFDAETYGRTLSAQLFADERLRRAWHHAYGYVHGAHTDLRLRLRLDQSLDELHSLH